MQEKVRNVRFEYTTNQSPKDASSSLVWFRAAKVVPFLRLSISFSPFWTSFHEAFATSASSPATQAARVFPITSFCTTAATAGISIPAKMK